MASKYAVEGTLRVGGHERADSALSTIELPATPSAAPLAEAASPSPAAAAAAAAASPDPSAGGMSPTGHNGGAASPLLSIPERPQADSVPPAAPPHVNINMRALVNSSSGGGGGGGGGTADETRVRLHHDENEHNEDGDGGGGLDGDALMREHSVSYSSSEVKAHLAMASFGGGATAAAGANGTATGKGGRRISVLQSERPPSSSPTSTAPSSSPSSSSSSSAEGACFDPSSPWLAAWSYVMFFLTIYNAVTIPYRLTFWSSPVELSIDVSINVALDAVSDLCFFVEIFLALRTGFVDNGVLVLDRRRVWQRYKRGWFLVDLITAVPFDLLQLIFGRVVPAVRIPKLLRILQVVHHYNRIEESMASVSLQFRLCKLLFYTLLLSHFTACVNLEEHTGHPFRDSIEARPQFGRYLQAMYWSIAAMTGRDDTNPPETLADAGFTIAMMVVGVLWLAYIIASLETFAHDGSNSSVRFQARLDYITQFMHQFQLPKELQAKVRAYYSYLWSSSLRYETEHFVSTLPSTLQADVQLQLHGVLRRAEIFAGVEPGCMAFLAQGLSTLVAVPGEIVCSAGETGLGGSGGAGGASGSGGGVGAGGGSACDMWFIAEGEVEILIGPKLTPIAKLRADACFGEYAIFLSSSRTSTARSVSYSTLLVLSGAHLLKALSLFPASGELVRAHVEEHRAKTLGQERNFLGLSKDGSSSQADNGASAKKKNMAANANSKLQKLINVEKATVVRDIDAVWTTSPLSPFYLRWQAVYFFVMAWNAIMLPLRFGFLPSDVNVGVMTIDYLTDVFLIIDIALTFRVRLLEAGGEVSDTLRIRENYVRGWLLPHVLASVPLDFIMLSSGMQPLLRLNRVIRLAHVHSLVLSRMKDSTHYEIMSLAYLISNFLMLSHWAGSIYFSFTRFEGFQADITLSGTSGSHLEPDYEGWRPASSIAHGPLIYQYLWSIYYAMALLAGIGRHLYPPSDVDVVLSLTVMLVGVFVVSYLIGKVGHLMFQLNASAAEWKAETAFVSQLLSYRKVDPEVSQRVTAYLRHTWVAQKGVDPNVALRGLPLQLKADIMMHVCADMMRAVPRFKDLDDSFVRQLVTELSFVELPAGEFVFRQGQIGAEMFFINSGLVEILFDAPLMTKNPDMDEEGGGSGSSPGRTRGGAGGGGGAATSDAASASSPGTQQQQQQHQQLKVLGPGSFFGEGALFSGTRAASIRARTPVRLLALSEASFQKVMHVHPHFAEKIMFLNAERQKLLEQRVAKRNSIYVHQQQLQQQRGGKHKRNGTNGGSNGNDVRTVGASRLGQQQQRAVVSPRRPSSLDATGAAGNNLGTGPAPSPSRSRGATIGGALPLRAAGPGTGLDNKVRLLVEESRRREGGGGGGTPTFGPHSNNNNNNNNNHMAIIASSPSAAGDGGGGAGGDISGGHAVASPITPPPGNSHAQPSAAARMLSFPAGSNNAAAGPRVTDLERSLHAGAHPPGYSPVDEQAAAATAAVDATASLLTLGNALAAGASSSASSTILPSGHARRPSMRRRSSEGALGFPAAATSSGNNVGIGGAGGVGFPGSHAHV